MISKSNVKFKDSEVRIWLVFGAIMRLLLFASKQGITIIRFGFCDIQNNQGLG